MRTNFFRLPGGLPMLNNKDVRILNASSYGLLHRNKNPPTLTSPRPSRRCQRQIRRLDMQTCVHQLTRHTRYLRPRSLIRHVFGGVRVEFHIDFTGSDNTYPRQARGVARGS